MPRSVVLNVALACLTVAAGLASRRYAELLPTFVAQYAGDALWAAMVFWLLAIGWRRTSAGRLAVASMAIAFTVECSQLLHASWIDGIRATTLGSLVLGSGFLWSDLACYVVGATLAAGVDMVISGSRMDNR